MSGSVSDSSAFRVQIRWSGAYRLITVVLAALFVVIAPLAVIGALVAAGLNFADGEVASGIWMLIVAAVLGAVLLVPAFFLWRRFLRRSKPLNLLIDRSGLALLEGDEVLRRLPWDSVAAARLSEDKGGRLIVSATRPGTTGTQAQRRTYTWMELPLAKMEGERGALTEALTRYSGGRYQTGR